MKKSFISLVLALLLPVSALADEGMWLLPLLQKMNADAMRNIGCRLTPEQIYDINNSSLKDAIVQFGGGCTGEIISDNGLLVTNHHCGYSNIQKLSSPEHNYLEDGYFALNQSEELPVPGLTVKFLQNMVDVTSILEKVSDKKRDEKIKELIDNALVDYPNCTANVVNFYNNNVQYLIVYKIFRDVRFVGAPPAAMGKFGGETDNWMWPRHTCDFSMFRVYAGPDNEPADYSENNIPYTPKQSLKVSLKGIQDGDFAMIMGYPGSTQRFQTATQLEHMIYNNEIRIIARTARQEVMWDEMEKDPDVRLMYANKYASSANGWKKWIGMRQAFANLDIIGRQQKMEDEYMEWVNKNCCRKHKYGKALEQIDKAVKESAGFTEEATLLIETLYNIEMPQFSYSFLATYKSIKEQAQAEGKELTEDEILSEVKEAIAEVYEDYYEPLDRRVASTLINLYLEIVPDDDLINIDFGDDIDAFVDTLFNESHFTSLEKMNAISSIDEVASEPSIAFFSTVLSQARYYLMQAREKGAKLGDATKNFTAGQLEWKAGEPSYPDANMTMRLTYGNVKSYVPKDGVLYRHFTTLKGVIEKEDPDNYEFRVPSKLKEIYEAKDFGEYVDADGTLHTCFLTNNDITGGNSGSPVLDADGNLIGLAFDGNWESMSSDVMFEPDLQRCICVDIRYVLLMVDKFAGAGYLLDEMNIVR